MGEASLRGGPVRVGLLVCDHVVPEIHGVAGDYEDMFVRLFSTRPEIELIPYDLPAGQFPSSCHDCDSWIITGSRRSVYEDDDWIHRLADLIPDLVESGRRMVGVCFGHQMLAHALGGKVERAEEGWGVGVKEVFVPEPPEWLSGTSFRILNSHADQITELPRGARVLGSNDHCPVSLMELGPNVIGIQGHPEFAPAYAEALLRRRRGRTIPRDIADEALSSLRLPIDDLSSSLADFLSAKSESSGDRS